MERSDGLDKMAVCREIWCSLLMMILGLLFCLSLAIQAYFFVPTIFEGVTSCTLWVDIPGRLVIFVTCYYLASICGFFPLPQRYHINSYIKPFNVWRLESWSRLFRNMCFPTRMLINWFRRKAEPIRDSLETPLLQESIEERFYNSQRKKQSEPIDIRYPESYVVPVFVSNPETTPRNESPEVNKGSDGSITSMGSSVGVFADQITRGRSPNRYYTSDASVEESPDDRARVSSKYRKRYTELKWPEEAAASASLPMIYDHTIVAERSAMPTLDKKSKAFTDDEKNKIYRQERRGLSGEMPQVHKNTPILVPRLSRHDYTLSRDENEQLLEEKSVPLAEDDKLVANRDPDMELKHEILKAHATDERFRVPTSTAMMNNLPRMHGRIKQPEGRTVYYKIKSPPKYREIYDEIKDARVEDDHTSVTSNQSLADKYFAPASDERYATARQQEPTKSTFVSPNLQASDGQIKVPTGKKLSTDTKFQSTMHPRNQQPGGSTATNEQETQHKHRNTETLLNFPKVPDKSQQPGGATANPENGQIKEPTGKKLSTDTKFQSTMHRRNRQPGGRTTATNEQTTQPKHHNTETRLNFPKVPDKSQQPGGATPNPANVRKTLPIFPRFPWQHLRNPRGVSARANKLHKKNLELEKREIKRQRRPNDFDELVRSLLDSLSSERITEMQLPRSCEKIRLIARSPLQMRDFSTKCSDGQSVRHKAGSGIVKDKTDLTKNRHKLTEKHEVEKIDKSHATNQGLPFISQSSNSTQEQYVERSNAAEATTRRLQLPSEISQVNTADR